MNVWNWTQFLSSSGYPNFAGSLQHIVVNGQDLLEAERTNVWVLFFSYMDKNSLRSTTQKYFCDELQRKSEIIKMWLNIKDC